MIKVAAAFAGLSVLIALSAGVLWLSFRGYLGYDGATIATYIGLLCASLMGAVAAGMISDTWLARILYAVAGAAAFFALSVAQSAFSDGHPDKALSWLPVLHLVWAAAGFFVVHNVTRGRPSFVALAGVTLTLALAGLAFGQVDKARWRGSLQAAAAENQRAAEQQWLPLLLSSAPAVSWKPVSYDDLFFTSQGELSGGRGFILLRGSVRMISAEAKINTKEDFQEPKGDEDTGHLRTRAVAYLKSQGFSDQVLQHFVARGPGSTYASEVPNIPANPADPGAGSYFIDVFFSPRKGGVDVSLSPGPVRK